MFVRQSERLRIWWNRYRHVKWGGGTPVTWHEVIEKAKIPGALLFMFLALLGYVALIHHAPGLGVLSIFVFMFFYRLGQEHPRKQNESRVFIRACIHLWDRYWGRPAVTGGSPKVRILVRSSTKRTLTAIRSFEARPISSIVGDCVRKYVEAMRPEDRRAVEVIARRLSSDGPAA